MLSAFADRLSYGRVFVCAVLFVFIASIGAVRLNAQVATATILGTVTDTSGAAIAEATVQVRNVGNRPDTDRHQRCPRTV